MLYSKFVSICNIKAKKLHFVHLTLKSRSKVKSKVTYVKVISGFLYVFYSKFVSICNIKANKLRFVHLTLKSRSKVKSKVTYVKVISGFLYVFYSTQHATCNILRDIHQKHYLLKSFMRNDNILNSTTLLHTINDPAKFQNDRSKTFREIACTVFDKTG